MWDPGVVFGEEGCQAAPAHVASGLLEQNDVRTILGFIRPLALVTIGAAAVVPGCYSSGGGSGGGFEADEDGGFDECGGDRASGTLGDVCREDCDCSVGYSCLTDDYDEQCCARELNDLDNGVWGIDCDGVQER